MAARGADNSSTSTTYWRLKEEALDILNVFTGVIDTNPSVTPVFMYDACNDPGSRFRSDESRLAGILNYINDCNDYDNSTYRWNTTISVVYVTRSPSECSSGLTCSLP